MKKIYMLTAACTLCCIAICHAQTRYWRGPVNGNWNSTANWSADGVSTGASIPNGASSIAIFDQGAPVVNVDLGAISLLSLVVTNNITAKLYTSIASTITASGNGSPNYALRIDAGSRLEDSVATDVPFNFSFSNAAGAQINGTWYFGGHSSVTIGSNGPHFSLPAASGAGNTVSVGGTVIIGNKAWVNVTNASINYLFFNAGSEFRIDRDGSSTPRATWASSSTIRVTGSVTGAPGIAGPNNFSIGNLVFDCAGMANEIAWSLPLGMTIAGNLQVLNTNNNNLVLANGVTPDLNYVVNGDFLISGNSWVTLGNNNNLIDNICRLQVNGNFIQSGGRFDLRAASNISVTKPTELKIKGSFTQTAGTFGCASPATGANLFVVELNGASSQNVDLASNSIDNATNQVKLRMNNGSGAVLVKPLSVGRLEWTGSNGIIAAGGQALTVNNTDPAAVIGAGANAFVAGGRVIRKTASNMAYSFPTGGTTYRPCELIPSAVTASEYSARYYPNSYSSTAYSTPLYKVSNAEYWDIGKVSGSDAAVSLSLAAAVPGAFGPDKVVVAHFNSGTSRWESVKGATGTEISPGNATSGTAMSEVLSSFSPFTFGVLPGSPLPVYLVAFNAKKLTNSSAKLDWTITASSNPDRFEVLRSEDGVSFHSIGTVKAAAQQLVFSFVDEQLPKRTAYYQLRMIDQQGVVMMSKIVPVFNNAEGWVINSMMPTLVTSQAKLNISASSRANIRLAVTDMHGRVVHQQQTSLSAGSQDVWINFSRLAAGAYQITGYLDNGQKTGSFRFIKQ
jgi:hypothetical protein